MEGADIKTEFPGGNELEDGYVNYNNLAVGNEIAGENNEEYNNNNYIAGGKTDAENMRFDFSAESDNAMFSAAAAAVTAQGGNLKCVKNVMPGENVKFEFTAGYRRNSVLIYLIEEKQLFTKKYAHNTMDRYTCYNKSCRASLLFDTSLNKIVKLYNTYHLHSDQSDIYKKMKVLNEMKDYCFTGDGLNLTTKQIFDQKCNVMKDAAHLVEYNKIKRNLNRLKKCAMQKPIANNYDDMYGGFSNDLVALANDYAMKWDSQQDNRALREASPLSDGDSLSTNTLIVDASSIPGPSHQSAAEQPPFKKVKLHQEVSYTEGYADASRLEAKTSQRKSPPPPNTRLRSDQDVHICSTCPCIAAQENQYDKIGRTWASELKMMTPEQQIYAKRAIADIIFEGQLGGLSRNSVNIRQTPRINEETCEEEYLYQKPEEIEVI